MISVPTKNRHLESVLVFEDYKNLLQVHRNIKEAVSIYRGIYIPFAESYVTSYLIPLLLYTEMVSDHEVIACKRGDGLERIKGRAEYSHLKPLKAIRSCEPN